MKTIKHIFIWILAYTSCSFAHAGVITQTFNSSWSIDVWDYYGDVSAMQWEYQAYTPWDASLGNLTSVSISTEFVGTRENASDTLRIRTGLFTGWDPVTYQYSETVLIDGGNANFSTNWSRNYTTPEALDVVTNYTYFTGIYDSGPGTGGAWYYFESRTENGAHSIEATTTLSFYYDAIVVNAPTTITLLGIALAGVSFMRRQK